MTDGGEGLERGMVRCRLIWNNAMVEFEQCASRDPFPTLAHYRENTNGAGSYGWTLKTF